MIARLITPAHLTLFEITLLNIPRTHLLLFLDLSKHDRSCVERLCYAGHDFDNALFIVVTVPDADIDYTPVPPPKKG